MDYIHKFRDFLNEEKNVDTRFSAKAVLHKDGQVLLLLNDMGWDLPGGHIHEGESAEAGLIREVREETNLTIEDPKQLQFKHGNKTFFSAALPPGEVTLSDEHSKHSLYKLAELSDIKISDFFVSAIKEALGEQK